MAAQASVQRARVCSRYCFTPSHSTAASTCCRSPPVRRASSVSQRRTSHTRQATSLSTVSHTFKKNWSKVASKDSDADAASLPTSTYSRITSVLNLDLPQKFWERISFTKVAAIKLPEQSKPEVKPPVKQRVHAIHLREDPYHNVNTPKADENSMALQVVEAELHDFETAITQMNSSVTDYLYETKRSLTSESGSSKPFSKPPSVIRKEMQLSFRQQVAKLLPNSVIRRSPKPAKPATPAKLCKRTIDDQTKGLVAAVRGAKSNPSRLSRLEDLCKHLEAYPEAKNLAVREKVLGALLRLRQEGDGAISLRAREALTLVGWTDPVSGAGIRVLSLDGGGTRGLVTLEILKRIEATTGQPIHKLFDLICGVSTGTLLALMLAVFRLPLSEAESIYKLFSREMFSRHPVVGASGVLTSYSYYDTQLWENILKENVGWQSFLETAQDPDTCKVACVSAIINLEKIQNFLFRNYTYAPGCASMYPGSMRRALWQAVRASSAAPTYYEEFTLGEFVHQDGGVLTNNPSAIALHECRLLWPGEEIYCLVSMGNGRYEPTGERLQPVPNVSIRGKIDKIVQSATDTEAVHTVLNDLLPDKSYFRFNPFMKEDFTLDEIREARWEQMQHEARIYCRKNQYKIDQLAARLTMPRSTRHKATDWLNMRRIMSDA